MLVKCEDSLRRKYVTVFLLAPTSHFTSIGFLDFLSLAIGDELNWRGSGFEDEDREFLLAQKIADE